MSIPSLNEHVVQELNSDVIVAESSAMRRIYEQKKKELKLNQSKLATLFGVKPPSIHAYLHGQTPLNFKFASFFAEQFQVPIDEFSPRLATAITKITGQVDPASFSYPLLSVTQIENNAELTKQYRDGTLITPSHPANISFIEQGFWLKLDSEDMESHSGGVSFCKDTLVLVDPNRKPNVNEYAIIKIKYDNPSFLLETNHTYLLRLIKRNGTKFIAHALNPNIEPIEINNESTELIGKVVSAIYPPSIFTL